MKTKAEEFLIERLGETELPRHRIILPAWEIVDMLQKYAEVYHVKQSALECHCGGYPDCICKLIKPKAEQFGINTDTINDNYNRG